jgi:hypothetical protein
MDSFYRDMGILFSNKDYVLLLLAFSIGVGFFNALLTLLNQIVNPFGYRYVFGTMFTSGRECALHFSWNRRASGVLLHYWGCSNCPFSHCDLRSNDDAGTFGAVFIVFGLVGAGCVGKPLGSHPPWCLILSAHKLSYFATLSQAR